MKITQIMLALLLAIPAGWVLLAPNTMYTVPRDGFVVVEYWEKWTGLEAEKMKAIVDEYNNTVGREKKIFVRYISMSAIDQKVLISTAGGAPPDIAGIWGELIAPFAAQNALYPLDDLAHDNGISGGDFKPVFWEPCHYSGKLYGMPNACASLVMMYNRQAFWENAGKLRAAGLDPTRGPQTIDELDCYAQALEQFSSEGELLRAGYLPTEPGWYIAFTGQWFGTSLVDESGKRFIIDNDASIRAFTWFESYSKRLGVQTASSFRNGFGAFASASSPFLIGKVLIEQHGPWPAMYIEQFTPQSNRLLVPKTLEVFLPLAMRNCNYTWAVDAFPSAVEGLRDVSVCPYNALVIPKGAKHKKEAFDFLAYLNRQEVMERFTISICSVSPLKNISRRYLTLHGNPYINVFERVAASPNAHHEPITPVFSELGANVLNAIERINLQQVDVVEGLRNAQQRSTESLKRFEAKDRARKQALNATER